jgi:hypothetical protein
LSIDVRIYLDKPQKTDMFGGKRAAGVHPCPLVVAANWGYVSGYDKKAPSEIPPRSNKGVRRHGAY